MPETSLFMRGDDVVALHQQLTGLGFTVAPTDLETQTFGPSTLDAVAQIQAASGLPVTGMVDLMTASAIEQRVAGIAPESQKRLLGRLTSIIGEPVTGVALELRTAPVLGKATTVASGTSDSSGYYSLDYTVDVGVGVELWAAAAGGHQLSDSVVNQSGQDVLNVVVPAEVVPVQPEFTRVTADLGAQVGADALAQLGATDGRDLDALHDRTGWDTRLIALNARSHATATATGMSAAATYALGRYGLPTDPDALAAVPGSTVAAALTAANDRGIVALAPDEIQAAVEQHTTFARSHGSTLASVNGLSSPKAFLSHVLDDDQQQAFDQVYLSGTTSGPALWDALAAANIPADAIGHLRTQGKLAVLTANNAPLVAALQDDVGADDLGTLVERGLATATGWKDRLTAVAGNAPLASVVPQRYITDPDDPAAVENGVAAYCADLATGVRTAFPTQAVHQLLESGTIALGTAAEHIAATPMVTQALASAAKLDFHIGTMPLTPFLAQHGEAVLIDAPVEDHAAVVEHLGRLQRMYQSTPSDDALKVMMSSGLRSASDIASFSRAEFLDRFGAEFPSLMEARLTHQKAQQISGVALNLFAGAAQLRSAPMFHALAEQPVDGVRPGLDAIEARLTEKFPTLESLFGSQDYCECESCQSVISPAAYVVDLLMFLDKATEHRPVPPGKKPPYEVFVSRRGDIPNIQLTCENTNTPLPYIDLVNEILEYYVQHATVDGPAAHDTGSVSSAELLTEPQNVIDTVYDKLATERFPLALPYDLPTDTIGEFAAQLKVDHWRLLDAFSLTDELFTVPNGPALTPPAYPRADVWTAQLRIPSTEYEILTDPAIEWWTLFGAPSEADALAGLQSPAGAAGDPKHTSAKRLARALGVTYRELEDIVDTWFVNPARGSATELAVVAPELGCDYDRTFVLQRAATPLDGFDLLRFHLFVRLWRRLGWTIDETDRALRAFLPGASGPGGTPLTAASIGPSLRSALVSIAHFRQLAATVKLPGRNRLARLLTIWSDIDTDGPSSLYAQLFLRPTVTRSSPEFVANNGAFLSDATKTIAGSITGIRAAIGLTADDIDAVIAHRGGDVLNVPNVSMLYRYAVMAKATGLSVDEVITLEELSGIDPFAGPPATLATPEDDRVLHGTIAFVELATALDASDLSIAELDLLVRHRFDPEGPLRPDDAARSAAVVQLADGVRQVSADLTLAVDPTGATPVTDEVVAKVIGRAMPPDAAGTFLQLWSGTFVFEVFVDALEADQLASATVAAVATVPGASTEFDVLLGRQVLRHRGHPTAATVTALRAAVGASVLGGSLIDLLAAKAAATLGSFGTLLDGADVDALLGPVPDAAAAGARTRQFATWVSGTIASRIRQQFLVDAVTTLLGSDPDITAALLTDAELLGGFAQDAAGKELSGAASLERLEQRGLTVEYVGGQPAPRQMLLAGDGRIDPPAVGDTEVRVRGRVRVPDDGVYAFHVAGPAGAVVELSVGSPAVDVTTSTATVAGGVDVKLVVTLGAGLAHEFDLRIAGATGAMVLTVEGRTMARGPVDRLVLDASEQLELADTVLVRLGKALRLLEGLRLGLRELRYFNDHADEFSGFDLTTLPTRPTPPGDAVALELFTDLRRLLDYAALRHEVAGGRDGLIDVFAAARGVPVQVDPANPDPDPVLTAALTRLATLGRVDLETLRGLATRFGLASDTDPTPTLPDQRKVAGLVDERGVRRLWQAARLVTRLGVPVATAIEWAVPTATAATADAVRDAVRARYDDEQWQRVAQPLFDRIRRRKRDALVAHIMASQQFTDPNQLFDFFLVDPFTEPVVQTSRLRLAMGSLQTFIQRCFLNLESEVSPATLDARKWEWARRQTYWAANRRIFLTPESFLEPEFRDDQTHLFRQLQGSLLQGDINDDLVEDAFFTYLTGLDQLAKLDVVTICSEPDSARPGKLVLHVIGRTHNQPHAYFHRRHRNGMWGPWEPIPEKIEGDHVVSIVYRGRLHVFWLTIAEVPLPAKEDEAPPGQQVNNKLPAPIVELKLQLHWSSLFEGKWSTQRAGELISTAPPTHLVTPKPPANPSAHQVQQVAKKASPTAPVRTVRPLSVFAWATHDGDQADASAVLINMTGSINAAFRYVSPNSVPVLTGAGRWWNFPYRGSDEHGTRTNVAGSLMASFPQQVRNDQGQVTVQNDHQPVFGRLPGPGKVLALGEVPATLTGEPGAGAWSCPFVYSDASHLMVVHPSVTETSWVSHDGWILDIRSAIPVIHESLIDRVRVEPAIPKKPGPFGDPVDWDPVDVRSKFRPPSGGDWLTANQTLLSVGTSIVAERGVVRLDAVDSVATVADHSEVVMVHGLDDTMAHAGPTLVAEGGLPAQLALSGSAAVGVVGQVQIVGGAGLVPHLMNGTMLSADLLRGVSGFGGGQ